ncbi:MAG: PQQ-binding-like beta-propeller repeat protein [Planctomycetes bacterium]|nr:PQQ-binding-like beta-propeller repeat protein [Planctomycetota bacterium]
MIDRPMCARLVALLSGVFLGLFIVLTGGCESQPVDTRSTTDYLVSLQEADELEYNIAWQSAVVTTPYGQVSGLYPYYDVVVTTENGRNFIGAVTTRDGTPVWESSVGDRLERLLGVVRNGDQLIANTQSDLYVLDIGNGSEVTHQKFGENNVASTSPFILGSLAIYGTPDGRVVYHHMGTGIMAAAYRLDSAITHAPIWLGDAIAMVTQSGTINVIDPGENSRIWMNRVRDPLTATPAVDSYAMYVAGRDQSVWAFRLADGKMVWRYRAQYALNDDPKVYDETVYVSIPDYGLVALDHRFGTEKWVCEEVAGGTVLTRNGQDLIVWDKLDNDRGSTFYRINGKNGNLEGTFTTTKIHWAASDKAEGGDVYGASRRGRMIKLVP